MNELLTWFDTRALAAAERHELLLDALIGLRDQQLHHGAAGLSPLGARLLREGAMKLAIRHLDSEDAHAAHDLQMLTERVSESAHAHFGTQGAQRIADRFPDVSESSHDAFHDWVMGELRAQLERDISQLVLEFRKAAIEHGDPARAAATRMTFVARDRAGRRVPARTHTHRTWRAMLSEHHRAVFLGLAERSGAQSLRIWHPDPNSRGYGETIRLDGRGPGLEDFAAIFHPNTRALPVSERHFMELDQ